MWDTSVRLLLYLVYNSPTDRESNAGIKQLIIAVLRFETDIYLPEVESTDESRLTSEG